MLISLYHPKYLHTNSLISQGKVLCFPSNWLCSQCLCQPLPNLFSLAGDMRLTCLRDILSQENYHRVLSIALRLPCTSYGPSDFSCLANLWPFCLLSLSLCRSPYGLGFVLPTYRHIFLFRPIALSSPSWELLPSWPFSGHAFSSTASEYGLTAICSSSLPSLEVSDYLAAYRLLRLRSLVLDLILSHNQTLLHGHLPRI